VIVDSVANDSGNTTGVRIRDTRESGEPVDSWYAVGPNALDGSLCTEQTATLDLCGHEVTYGCDCDTIAAEAADQDDCPCGCEVPEECTLSEFM
jgi:hypothetical protein